MSKTNYTCPKCQKECKSEKALKQHNFMMHTHAGSKVRKMTKKGKTVKTKTHAVVIDSLSELAPKIKSLAFCPCCGTDLRKVAVAMTM